MCGSDWPVLLLNGDYDRVWRDDAARRRRSLAPRRQRPPRRAMRHASIGSRRRGRETTSPSTRRRHGRAADRPGDREDQGPDRDRRVHARREAAEGAGPGQAARPLPQLVARGGSGVDARSACSMRASGDGTYVTSLDSELLLAGMGFVGDLLAGPTLLELHQVRRILEPVATALATPRLTERTSRARSAASTGWTRPRRRRPSSTPTPSSTASSSAAAAMRRSRRSSRTCRAGCCGLECGGRSASEGAVEITRQRHRDIYLALRAADAERASAADLVHLAEGEEWLRRVIATGDTLALTGRVSPDGDHGHGP